MVGNIQSIKNMSRIICGKWVNCEPYSKLEVNTKMCPEEIRFESASSCTVNPVADIFKHNEISSVCGKYES
jgi:hypothetical protein